MADDQGGCYRERSATKGHTITKAWMTKEWKNFNLSNSFQVVVRLPDNGTQFGIDSMYPFWLVSSVQAGGWEYIFGKHKAP